MGRQRKQTIVHDEPRTRVVVEIPVSVDDAARIAAAKLGIPKWQYVEMALRELLKLDAKGAA